MFKKHLGVDKMPVVNLVQTTLYDPSGQVNLILKLEKHAHLEGWKPRIHHMTVTGNDGAFKKMDPRILRQDEFEFDKNSSGIIRSSTVFCLPKEMCVKLPNAEIEVELIFECTECQCLVFGMLQEGKVPDIRGRFKGLSQPKEAEFEPVYPTPEAFRKHLAHIAKWTRFIDGKQLKMEEFVSKRYLHANLTNGEDQSSTFKGFDENGKQVPVESICRDDLIGEMNNKTFREEGWNFEESSIRFKLPNGLSKKSFKNMIQEAKKLELESIDLTVEMTLKCQECSLEVCYLKQKVHVADVKLPKKVQLDDIIMLNVSRTQIPFQQSDPDRASKLTHHEHIEDWKKQHATETKVRTAKVGKDFADLRTRAFINEQESEEEADSEDEGFIASEDDESLPEPSLSQEEHTHALLLVRDHAVKRLKHLMSESSDVGLLLNGGEEDDDDDDD